TAREPLRAAGEEQLRLMPLTVPDEEAVTAPRLLANDAVRLFVANARRTVPDLTFAEEDLSRIAAIVRALEGVPLAIELAAARLAEQPLAALAAALARRGPGADAVRTALEASLAGLEAEELQFLCALGVFAGGFELAMAAAVAIPDGDRFVTLDALARLLERALITIVRADRAEPRYRLLEPVRRAALARANSAGATRELGLRHRQAYLDAVQRLAPALTGGASQPRALAWLEAEHENVLAAITCAGGPVADPQVALRLAGSTWWFWHVRGHFERGRAALASALERPGAEASTPARALALFAAGGLAYFQGDRFAGRAYSLQAGAAFESLGDTLGGARAPSHVALCDQDDGDVAQAAAGFARACAIFRARGDGRRLSVTLNNIGVLDRLRDDFAAARTHHAEALELQRAAGDRDASIVTLLNLALAAIRLDQRDEAARHLREALTLVRDLRARRSGAAAL